MNQPRWFQQLKWCGGIHITALNERPVGTYNLLRHLAPGTGVEAAHAAGRAEPSGSPEYVSDPGSGLIPG